MLIHRNFSPALVWCLVAASACSSKGPTNADDSPGGSGGASGSGNLGGSAGASGGAGGSTSAGAGGTAGSGATVGGSAGAGGNAGTSAAGANGANGGMTSGGSAGSGAAGASTGGSAGAGAAGAGAGGGAGTGAAGAGGSAGLTGNGCTPAKLTETGELHGRYETLQPTIGDQEYFMQVNEWNSMAEQVMAYGGDFFFKMTTQTATASTNGAPTGFPSMFIGANSRHTTANSNLPKQVSALSTVPTSWIWNDNGTLTDGTSIYNATYDVWFSTKAEGEPTMSGPSGGYLMVWLHDPDLAEPIGGEPMYSGVTVAGVPGTWDVWVGPNGSRPCISYVATDTTLALSFDLNAFIKDAVANRPDTIKNEWYLTNIFTGFEIWSGGQGLESTAFCAVVN